MGLGNPFYAPYTPLLDPDWDDPQEWLDTLRTPQSPALYDLFPTHNSVAVSWEDAEKLSCNANRLHSAYLTDEIIAPRAARRKLLQEAVREETALNAAMRKQAIAREAQKRQARAEAEAIGRRMWAERRWTPPPRAAERQRILAENWGCERCKGPAVVYPHGEQYKLVCFGCRREAIVEHERIMVVMNAQRPQ